VSLDKFLLDQKIVESSLRWVAVGARVAAEKANVSKANRDYHCTRGTVFDCTRIQKFSTAWCAECKLRNPFHIRLKDIAAKERLALKNLKQLCEQRERMFPRK